MGIARTITASKVVKAMVPKMPDQIGERRYDKDVTEKL
jgi:hypothetical protein